MWIVPRIQLQVNRHMTGGREEDSESTRVQEWWTILLLCLSLWHLLHRGQNINLSHGVIVYTKSGDRQ